MAEECMEGVFYADRMAAPTEARVGRSAPRWRGMGRKVIYMNLAASPRPKKQAEEIHSPAFKFILIGEKPNPLSIGPGRLPGRRREVLLILFVALVKSFF